METTHRPHPYITDSRPVTTISEATNTDYLYVVGPMRVVPDHLCCLRWALIYAKHLNDFQFLDEEKMVETLAGITGWPE